MKRAAIVIIAVLTLAATPLWAQTRSFDWEDGTSTAQGKYPADPGSNLTYENSTEQAHGGTHSLKLIENPASGTPQAYIWWVTGLTDGDTIDASFWVYSATLGTNPRGRIWGHYTVAGSDINDYGGSAGGNASYNEGGGWSQLSHSWTYDSNAGANDGLVVEARIYSAADGDFIYIDDTSITVTAMSTVVISAPDGSIPVELMSFSVE
jgi:hypothetical protein